MELCARAKDGDQQVALYGLGRQRADHVLVPTDVTSSGFNNPAAALLLGESSAPSTADATVGAPGSMSAALTLADYRPNVPTGAVVDSVVVRVAHRDEAD